MNVATAGARKKRLYPFHRGWPGEDPDCAVCPLSRCKKVPPQGNPRAQIALVGEGPGFEEERWGSPFIGDSGQKLDEFCAAIGVSRDELWIDNGALCRPRGIRVDGAGPRPTFVPIQDVKDRSVRACRVRLLTGLARLPKLRVVVPLGKLALGSLTGGWHRSILAFRGGVLDGALTATIASAREDRLQLYKAAGVAPPAVVAA